MTPAYRKILFIVNPIAGRKHKHPIDSLIHKHIHPSIQYKIVYWDDPILDFYHLIHDNLDPDTNIIAAVGGDGTINNIASQLIYTDICLAIIPFGSGNGIARHLQIPINPIKAIELLHTGVITNIDACSINEKHFVTTSGVGFDAYISYLFSTSKNRGFRTYVNSVFKTFLHYKPRKYTLIIDGEEIREKAFLVTIANANQYGNNAIIAPRASVHDGLLDIVIMKRPNLLESIGVVIRLFARTIDKSKLIKYYKGKKVVIKRKKKGEVHYDGESGIMKRKIKIKVLPSALKVVVHPGLEKK
jgi:YegS/Rv2252/BmrU family lipid kinase